jgi:4-carboxymuconolactone decarboxylase
MSGRPTSPRISPLPINEQDSQARDLLAAAHVEGTLASNIFTTLVRHPGLFRKWTPFSGKLLAGKLPPRDRELLILRTGWRCQSEYEWGQHALLAKDLGLTDSDLTRLREGPGAAGWDEFDAYLLRAADELHDESCISERTWEVLASRYDDRQLIEVVMVVGHYHLVAFTLNSLGVQPEPGLPGFEGSSAR